MFRLKAGPERLPLQKWFSVGKGHQNHLESFIKTDLAKTNSWEAFSSTRWGFRGT